jgi:hypothetical protein
MHIKCALKPWYIGRNWLVRFIVDAHAQALHYAVRFEKDRTS